ncbi:MAG: dihydroneopterin aldolase [Oleiphilaceae bacterium]|jgi:dihydroneopterin aldolase
MANGYFTAFGVSRLSIHSNNSDNVLIESLALDASIGVFDWEKKIKQRLVFNLELVCDFSKAAMSDDIHDAVNYAQVCEEIEILINLKHYQLLEFLAERICCHLFEVFAISAINLSIHKPDAVSKTKSVGVAVFRERTDSHSTTKEFD